MKDFLSKNYRQKLCHATKKSNKQVTNSNRFDSSDSSGPVNTALQRKISTQNLYSKRGEKSVESSITLVANCR